MKSSAKVRFAYIPADSACTTSSNCFHTHPAPGFLHKQAHLFLRCWGIYVANTCMAYSETSGTTLAAPMCAKTRLNEDDRPTELEAEDPFTILKGDLGCAVDVAQVNLLLLPLPDLLEPLRQGQGRRCLLADLAGVLAEAL